MKTVSILAAMVFLMTTAAEARRYDSRPFSGFRTGHCKRASCFRHHPSGRYVYPLHYGHGHHRRHR